MRLNSLGAWRSVSGAPLDQLLIVPGPASLTGLRVITVGWARPNKPSERWDGRHKTCMRGMMYVCMYIHKWMYERCVRTTHRQVEFLTRTIRGVMQYGKSKIGMLLLNVIISYSVY